MSLLQPSIDLVRILIVEDDEGDALLTRELLTETHGRYEAKIARTLADAVRLLGIEFECVLLDLGLPDAAGREALEAVLAVAPGSAVIVLTGRDDHDAAIAAVSAGAQDYLVKGSVDAEVLTRAIRYSIERKRADETARSLLARELSAAESIRLERGLLPRPMLTDPKMRAAVRYRSGGGAILLGGDFFDAVEKPDGTIRLVIGDVAGHSADEAATGVALRIAWRSLVLADIGDADILPALEALLEAERPNDNLFATVLDVSVRPDRRSMTLRPAGHPAPIVADPMVRQVVFGRVGPPLGISSPSAWPEEEVALGKGWTAIFFTDGLVEGRTLVDRTARWGPEGLVGAVRSSAWNADGLGPLADSLVASAEKENGGPVADDIALLLLAEDV